MVMMKAGYEGRSIHLPTIDWSSSAIDCWLPWQQRLLRRVRDATRFWFFFLGGWGGVGSRWAGGASEGRRTCEAEVAVEVLMLFTRGEGWRECFSSHLCQFNDCNSVITQVGAVT